MWIRICLLATVALSMVSARGTYRLVHPALVPGWLDRFPNSRILLNRDYYNYLYRRIILRDPYWRSRIHLHRRFYPGFFRSQRIINPILLRRNLRFFAPQVQTSVVNYPQTIPQDHRHLIGKSETFVRYSSPSIDRYNTPWQKISSSYRDYGEASSPALYDRPFYGGSSAAVLPAGYDNEEFYDGIPAPASSASAGLYDDQIGEVDSGYGYGLQESGPLGAGGFDGFGGFSASLGLGGADLDLSAGGSNFPYVQPRRYI